MDYKNKTASDLEIIEQVLQGIIRTEEVVEAYELLMEVFSYKGEHSKTKDIFVHLTTSNKVIGIKSLELGLAAIRHSVSEQMSELTLDIALTMKLIALPPTVKIHLLELYYIKAQILLSNGRIKELEHLISEGLKIDQKNLKLHLYQTIIHLSKNNDQEALSCIKSITTKAKDIKVFMSNFEEALKEVCPNEEIIEQIFYLMGCSLYEMGHHKEAISTLKNTRDIKHQRLEKIGDAYSKLGDVENAILAYDEAFKITEALHIQYKLAKTLKLASEKHKILKEEKSSLLERSLVSFKKLQEYNNSELEKLQQSKIGASKTIKSKITQEIIELNKKQDEVSSDIASLYRSLGHHIFNSNERNVESLKMAIEYLELGKATKKEIIVLYKELSNLYQNIGSAEEESNQITEAINSYTLALSFLKKTDASQKNIKILENKVESLRILSVTEEEVDNHSTVDTTEQSDATHYHPISPPPILPDLSDTDKSKQLVIAINHYMTALNMLFNHHFLKALEQYQLTATHAQFAESHDLEKCANYMVLFVQDQQNQDFVIEQGMYDAYVHYYNALLYLIDNHRTEATQEYSYAATSFRISGYENYAIICDQCIEALGLTKEYS